ncbi:hypothetical protein ACFW2S_33105, partial [Streptomyces sp. NPDC058874]
MRRRRRAGKACTDAVVEVVGEGRGRPQRSFAAGLWTRTDRPIAPLAEVVSVFSTRYDKQRTDHCGRSTPGALVAQL